MQFMLEDCLYKDVIAGLFWRQHPELKVDEIDSC